MVFSLKPRHKLADDVVEDIFNLMKELDYKLQVPKPTVSFDIKLYLFAQPAIKFEITVSQALKVGNCI